MTEKKLNILIIRLSSMGDVVLTTSLVRQIRNKFPDSRIDFVTAKQFTEIYRFNPHLTNIVVYDKSSNFEQIANQKRKLKEDLPSGRYDYVIDLQRNMRSKIFRSGLGQKYFFVHKRRLHKLSLVYFKRPLFKNLIPIAEFNRLCVKDLNIEDDNLGLEIWLNEKENKTNYPSVLKNSNTPVIYKIAIAPGAYHFTKRYPKERFLDLIDSINKKINAEFYLIGGTQDKGICEFLKENSNANITDNSGETSILETTRILDKMNVLITNDTGVMHIAAARKVPVLAIFGSTVKELGFTPYGTENKIVEANVDCRPCTHIGRNQCPKKHFNCMMNISIEKIIKELIILLKIQEK